ncbi:uncharacterized protein LOC144295103 isoform X2 [Canis aureus]
MAHPADMEYEPCRWSKETQEQAGAVWHPRVRDGSGRCGIVLWCDVERPTWFAWDEGVSWMQDFQSKKGAADSVLVSGRVGRGEQAAPSIPYLTWHLGTSEAEQRPFSQAQESW